jgi:hypothetical protein
MTSEEWPLHALPLQVLTITKDSHAVPLLLELSPFSGIALMRLLVVPDQEHLVPCSLYS